MRIATWNLARKRPASPTGKLGVQHLLSLNPDVAILTEARIGHLGDSFQHADAGSSELPHLHPSERKVVVASRWPIRCVETRLEVPTLGRYVSAEIEAPIGVIRVIGLCIPWFASRVRSGGVKNWEDHRVFLRALAPVLASSAEVPCVIAGDFNQRIPRSKQPQDVADLLSQVFESYALPTAGVRSGTGRQLIDHIAVSRHFEVEQVQEWAGQIEGRAASDHDGVLVEVGALSP